jgi:hypothetical protein
MSCIYRCIVGLYQNPLGVGRVSCSACTVNPVYAKGCNRQASCQTLSVRCCIVGVEREQANLAMLRESETEHEEARVHTIQSYYQPARERTPASTN